MTLLQQWLIFGAVCAGLGLFGIFFRGESKTRSPKEDHLKNQDSEQPDTQRARA
jgi:hypothetical protein